MKRSIVLLGMTLLCAVLTAASGTAYAQDFVVVVNSANPVSAMSKQQVSDVFLKKVTKWENKTAIIPVDQDKDAKIRNLFAKAVHGRSASSIQAYWQTQIFSGNNVPPATKSTNADVLAFVRSRENAIGYVSAGTTLGPNVKAVTVTGL